MGHRFEWLTVDSCQYKNAPLGFKQLLDCGLQCGIERPFMDQGVGRRRTVGNFEAFVEWRQRQVSPFLFVDQQKDILGLTLAPPEFFDDVLGQFY